MKWDQDYVKEASKKNSIVPGFNVFGYEDAGAIIRAAERANMPILVMINRSARKDLNLEHWGSLLNSMASASSVPVGVHLDHSSNPDTVRRAINSGFTSVMYDGSKLPFEENVRISAELTKEAHAKGVYIETELGAVPYDDMGQTNIVLTDPEEAMHMFERVNMDWLAVSIGNIHRLVGRTTPIKFDVLDKIQEVCKAPLVVHGSSGINTEDLFKLKSTNVGKINMGTAIRKAIGDALRLEVLNNPEVFDRQKLLQKPIEIAEEVAFNTIKFLS